MKRSRKLAIILVALSAIACGPETDLDQPESIEIGQVSQALRAGPERAFAWANSATGVYTPDFNYAFNGSGGPIVITTTGTGRYFVRFEDLNSYRGNYQVVAYGTGSHRCKVVSWWDSGAQVQCHDYLGQPANSQFVISYTNDLRQQPDTVAAFLWAHNSSASHTPHSTYSYNSTGAENFVHRFGVGVYYAQLPGLNAERGNAQVTAYGSDSKYCKLNSWFRFFSDTVVGVQCYAPGGFPVDSRFSLQFVADEAQDEVWNRSSVWVDQPLNPNPHAPAALFNINSLVQTDTANRARQMGRGRVQVVHTEFHNFNSTAMVSALGLDAVYCKPERWFDAGGDTEMWVNCFDPYGMPADSTFSALYLQEESECVSPPCEVFPHLVHPGRYQAEDNPRLQGYASWPVNWEVTGDDQSYGGPVAPVVRTIPESILQGMDRSGFAPTVPGGSAITYEPSFTSFAGPWIEFPCSTPPCELSGSAPFWAPGLALPRDHSNVRVELVDATGTSFPDQVVNEVTLTLDPDVHVVPIHLYVLRDGGGGVPSRYDWRFRVGTDAEIAANIQQEFDQANVTYPLVLFGRSQDSVTARGHKARNPLAKRTFTSKFTEAELPFFGDDIFGQCDVQLRLESVSFVRQNQGFEDDLLLGSEIGDIVDHSCTTARAVDLARSLVQSTESSLGSGVHVIVGGWLGQNDDSQSRGLACTGERFMYIDAGAIGSTFRMQTIFHEIGHVLMGSGSHDSDPDNLMHESTEGTLLNATQCSSIRNRASTF